MAEIMTVDMEKKDQEDRKMSFYQKIQKIIDETGFIPKNGKNAAQHYVYVQESDVVNALRGKMAKYGITMVPNLKEIKWLESVPTRNGGSMSHVEVDMEYKFVDVDDPSQNEMILMAGEGMDSSDKAINKAITASKKYALLLFFLLPTGDDPEKDETVDTEVVRKRTKKIQKVSPDTLLKDLPLSEKEKLFKAFEEFDTIELDPETTTYAQAKELYLKLKKEVKVQ